MLVDVTFSLHYETYGNFKNNLLINKKKNNDTIKQIEYFYAFFLFLCHLKQ